MKTQTLVRLVVLCSLLTCRLVLAAPLGTAFTYQGRLNDGANPANGSYDLRFMLYDMETGGVQQGGVLTNNAVTISGGLFTVTLDFGARFDGNARWLEIGVRTNGSGAFAPLSPRQLLSATPYAIYAPSAGTAATASGVTPGSVVNNSLAASAITSDKIADGSIAANDLSPSLQSNTFWRLRGNTATSPSLDFLGTVDANPLKLRANNVLGWRLEPTIEGYLNVIGGRNDNTSATYGSAVGGGAFNAIATNSEFSSIGGGYQNQIGSNAFNSTIAGGYTNVIGSGAGNSAIGGGSYNQIQAGAYGSAIGGGQGNTVGGRDSTVPGGFGNTAMGQMSFAAGSFAKANHLGTFVWSDWEGTDFASTAANQFLIRAAGGMGINKNNPSSALDVNGTVSATGFNAAGPVRLNDNEIYFHPNDIFHGLGWYGNPRYFAGINVNGPVLYGFGGGALGYTGNGTNVALLWNAYGNVGIGKLNPATALDVNGSVTATSYRGAAGNALSLGTTDTQPLQFMVNNQTGLRLEPGGSNSVNVIGGWSGNSVGPGVIGATVSGGGAGDYYGTAYSNRVDAYFGTVSGGSKNTIQAGAEHAVIGGGYGNTIQTSSDNATIGGGQQNTIETSANDATISGGFVNTIYSGAGSSGISAGYANTIERNADCASIGGGFHNSIGTNAWDSAIGGGSWNSIQADAYRSTIAGGSFNTNLPGAQFATIPGGLQNTAADRAFAAGTRAKANHSGTFVWADSTDADFASTASKQFLIRAAGGVGINKNNPVSALDVSGTVTASAFSGSGGNVYGLNAANFSSGTLDDARLSGNVALLNAGQIFTGAKTFADHVRVSDRQIYLRGGSDNYHGLGWFLSSSFAGANPDGPVLYGFAGGSLGTTAGGQRIALAWSSTGNVGIGTANPATTLDVNGEVSAQIVTAGSQLRLTGARTVISGFDGNGSHWFGPSPDSDLAFELRRSAANNYSFTLKGDFYGRSFNLTSDRNQKENFKSVDPQAVLEKVAALPISEWNFKGDASTSHIGPMAQDFHAAFAVGPDDKHIATVDAEGVALAAIQGLNQKLEDRLQQKEAELTELKQTVNELKELVGKLTHKLEGGAK